MPSLPLLIGEENDMSECQSGSKVPTMIQLPHGLEALEIQEIWAKAYHHKKLKGHSEELFLARISHLYSRRGRERIRPTTVQYDDLHRRLQGGSLTGVSRYLGSKDEPLRGSLAEQWRGE